MGVSAAREADAQDIAHRGMGSVAPGEIRRFARLLGPVRPPQAGPHALAVILEAEELGPALDLDPRLAQPVDQEPLVLVLREDHQVRERTQALPHRAEADTGGFPAPHPQVCGRELQSLIDHRLGQADLPVELERPRVDHQGP